jgi:hypothetical protein
MLKKGILWVVLGTVLVSTAAFAKDNNTTFKSSGAFAQAFFTDAAGASHSVYASRNSDGSQTTTTLSLDIVVTSFDKNTSTVTVTNIGGSGPIQNGAFNGDSVDVDLKHEPGLVAGLSATTCVVDTNGTNCSGVPVPFGKIKVKFEETTDSIFSFDGHLRIQQGGLTIDQVGSQSSSSAQAKIRFEFSSVNEFSTNQATIGANNNTQVTVTRNTK